jgi:hypothetical protein
MTALGLVTAGGLERMDFGPLQHWEIPDQAWLGLQTYGQSQKGLPSKLQNKIRKSPSIITDLEDKYPIV